MLTTSINSIDPDYDDIPNTAMSLLGPQDQKLQYHYRNLFRSQYFDCFSLVNKNHIFFKINS